MIVRTPPAKRQRPLQQQQQQQQQLIIYEGDETRADDPIPSHSDHMLCTYQCRQMVKSEFLDALSSAEKQARDFESKFHQLDDAYSKADADSKKLREQLLNAQQELAAAKARETSLQDQLLKESRDFHQRYKSHMLSHSDVEVKLQNEIILRKKAESLAASAQEKITLLDGQLARLSETADWEKKLLHSELLQLKRDFELSISQKSADLEKMECRAINAEKESALLSEQLHHLKKQLDSCLEQKTEAEKKLVTFTCQESTTTTDSDMLVKHLQEELRNYESEVREARKLRSSHEQIELLKEKLWEERGRREKAESEMCKMQELQLRIKNLEDELLSWNSIIEEIPGMSCPDDVPVKFAALQREAIEGTMKVGEANTLLKQMEVAVDAAQLSKHHAETEAALAKEKVEESVTEIKRIQSMLTMTTEERDKFRNHVNELNRQKINGAGSEAANATFMQELESSLAMKESCIKELEINLLEYKEVNNRLRNEITVLNDRLTNEGRRIKSLERESDQLRSEISLLESKLGHGEFSTANTKVLRMVNTLGVDSEAKQTIDALQAELQKTKDRLKAVEELNNQSGDAGKFVDSIISEKIIQLKEQIATLEKREERYKTVFADRISVFRRACCELFGYKIVMDEHQRSNGIPVTHFTLRSIYAQNDDEKLEFDYESGSMTILANDYASQPDISHQIGIFIRKLNSIPAFTANLTVESFNRRTLS